MGLKEVVERATPAAPKPAHLQQNSSMCALSLLDRCLDVRIGVALRIVFCHRSVFTLAAVLRQTRRRGQEPKHNHCGCKSSRFSHLVAELYSNTLSAETITTFSGFKLIL